MSGFGGNSFGGNSFGGGGRSNSGGRGGRGGRGRGRGRGRSGGRGGYNNNNNNNNSRNFPKAILNPCQHFTKSGNCSNGNNCKFAHVIRLHGIIDASTPMQNNNQNNNYNSNRYNNNKNQMHSVTAVSNWKQGDNVKIFSGSQDGFWRLWGLANGNFVKEFEHNMQGSVECLEVASNFLFCGFEAITPALPEVSVGMIHAWGLNNPSGAPLEFHTHSLIPYAHSTAVSKILVDGQKVISGAKDGSIKLWNFEGGRFVLKQTLHGHAREITGLALADGNFLWSSSTDGSIRIWDLSKNGECQYKITMPENPTGDPQQAPYHTDAITGLVSFATPNGTFILSSSLDGYVKAWDKGGQCVASEGHGEGVVTIAMGEDPNKKQFLIIGLQSGNISARNLFPTQNLPKAFSLIFTLSAKYTAAHTDAVKTLSNGIIPGTFCTGGMDGKVLVFEINGDIGL